MCTNQNCFGYFSVFVVLFFAFLIYALLKTRKALLKKDLNRSANLLWPNINLNFPNSELKKQDLIFSVWQDRSATMSFQLIKNHLDEVIGRVEYPLGAREYKLIISDQEYRIVVNLTFGGTDLSLYSSDNHELARIQRKSFQPMKHTITINGFGVLKSEQPRFSLKSPIKYLFNGNLSAYTQFVSPLRRVGRVGCFSNVISLPVRIFILAMTS